MSSLRDKRTGRDQVRKGTADLIRITQTHADRRKYNRLADQSEEQDAMDEWADELEGNTIWKS